MSSYKLILNIVIDIGEVPSAFGLGLVTPIPKFKGNKKSVCPDDFRGITINVMESKIFEHSIISYFDNLITSDRQFGFKKGLDCSHAIHLVRNTINYFNSRGNTVNLGFIDVKKAFDKASFWGILLLLHEKHINLHIINVLEFWFSIGSARVCWGGAISEPIRITGVRKVESCHLYFSQHSLTSYFAILKNKPSAAISVANVSTVFCTLMTCFY